MLREARRRALAVEPGGSFGWPSACAGERPCRCSFGMADALANEAVQLKLDLRRNGALSPRRARAAPRCALDASQSAGLSAGGLYLSCTLPAAVFQAALRCAQDDKRRAGPAPLVALGVLREASGNEAEG